jgi:hypothetical protein
MAPMAIAVGEGGGVDDPAAGLLDGGDGADPAPGADRVGGDVGFDCCGGGVHRIPLVDDSIMPH